MSEVRQKWIVANPLRDVLLCAFIGSTPGGMAAGTYDDPRYVVGGIVGTVVGLTMWLMTALKRKHDQATRTSE
jgi:hypothetical protein